MSLSLPSWLWGSSRRAPPTVPTDEVLPMYPFDNVRLLRGLTLVWTLRFDDVLDPDILASSLSQLFEMEGWRRLGGRLRLRPDGLTEVHVPREFSAERPSIYFTKKHFDVSLAEHPEASKLPQATNSATIFPGTDTYKSLTLGPGAPKDINDYLYSDMPLFALHVVTFTDGTLVSLTFNHAISDLGGLTAILNGWRCIMAGRPEEIPPFMSLREDPTAGLYELPKADIKAIPGQLVGWRLIVWVLRQLYNSWMEPLESRIFCIPSHIADAMVQRARSDLGSKKHDISQKTYISEHDALLALINQAIGQTLPRGWNISTLVPADLRYRAPSVMKQHAAYVQNVQLATFFKCSQQEITQLSLGELALKTRREIASQLTEAAIKNKIALYYERITKTGNPPIFGDTESVLLALTNWSRGRIVEGFDCSPAVVHASKKGIPGAKLGHPVYFHSESQEMKRALTPVMGVMGRDGQNNLWLLGGLREKSWSYLIDYLNSLVQ